MLENMEVKTKNVRSSQFSCAGTKIQQFLEYKKLSYICIGNIKIIIVCAHKDSGETPLHTSITENGY